jgi:hypothetical protein
VHNRSKFAQHVIGEGHSFSPMNEIMEVIHVTKKSRMLDTLEEFYIYRETTYGTQINDKLTIQFNLIFEALVQHSPHRELQPHTKKNARLNDDVNHVNKY